MSTSGRYLFLLSYAQNIALIASKSTKDFTYTINGFKEIQNYIMNKEAEVVVEKPGNRPGRKPKNRKGPK